MLGVRTQVAFAFFVSGEQGISTAKVEDDVARRHSAVFRLGQTEASTSARLNHLQLVDLHVELPEGPSGTVQISDNHVEVTCFWDFLGPVE